MALTWEEEVLRRKRLVLESGIPCSSEFVGLREWLIWRMGTVSALEAVSAGLFSEEQCSLVCSAKQMNQHHNYSFFLIPGTQNTANHFRTILASCPVIQISKQQKSLTQIEMSWKMLIFSLLYSYVLMLTLNREVFMKLRFW